MSIHNREYLLKHFTPDEVDRILKARQEYLDSYKGRLNSVLGPHLESLSGYEDRPAGPSRMQGEREGFEF